MRTRGSDRRPGRGDGRWCGGGHRTSVGAAPKRALGAGCVVAVRPLRRTAESCGRPVRPVGAVRPFQVRLRTPVALALACALFQVAELGSWVAVTIRAEANGGVREASAVLVAELVPAALVALLIGRLVRPANAVRILVLGLAGMTAGLGGAAVAVAVGGSTGRWGLYACAVLASMATVVVRPALGATVAATVLDPRRRGAFQALLSWIGGGAMLAGPVVTGAAVAGGAPEAAFVVFAAATAIAACCVLAVPHRRRGASGPVPVTPRRMGGVVQRVRSQRGVPALLTLLAVEGMLIGALDLLIVVLPGSGADPAYYATALGGGALAGGAVAGILSRRGHLAVAAGIAGAVAGGAVAGLAPAAVVWVLLGVLAIAGAALAALRGLGHALLQVLSPAVLAGPAFAALEGLDMVMLLVGVLVVPVAITLLGVPGAVLLLGAASLAAVLCCLRSLVLAERLALERAARVVALSGHPLLRDVDVTVVENLAAWARVVRSEHGTGPATTHLEVSAGPGTSVRVPLDLVRELLRVSSPAEHPPAQEHEPEHGRHQVRHHQDGQLQQPTRIGGGGVQQRQ
ncbi:MFS transporter [Nakamurella sp. YIM 132087]|uniref:MFS transporter n=1 Tax=Nakamurella alba TaxID=2665158 RepID=A0A7K1FS30_9ACTN|nr:MFS transporter [Nakamurella alba]